MQPQVGRPWFRSTCNEKTQIITINAHVLALAFYSFDKKVMETFCIKTRTIVFKLVLYYQCNFIITSYQFEAKMCIDECEHVDTKFLGNKKRLPLITFQAIMTWHFL